MLQSCLPLPTDLVDIICGYTDIVRMYAVVLRQLECVFVVYHRSQTTPCRHTMQSAVFRVNVTQWLDET